MGLNVSTSSPDRRQQEVYTIFLTPWLGFKNLAAVGFEPTLFRTGALNQRLRPLGHATCPLLQYRLFIIIQKPLSYMSLFVANQRDTQCRTLTFSFQITK